MTQIEAFVDSVYQNVGGNKKEIQELKAEMKSHLLEAVYELKLEGKTEQEAIEIAIDRFGGEKEMRSIVAQLFRAQKTFIKWVLYLAVAFLIISVSTFVIERQKVESNANQISYVATDIRSLLGNKTSVTPQMGEEIERLVKGTDFISSVKIYNVREVKESDYKNYDRGIFEYVEHIDPDYQYHRSVWAPDWLKPRFFPYGNGDDKWLVNMEERYLNMPTMAILFAGVAIYWTLFSIWAIINAYHHKRLNIGWILVFTLFNLLGYLIYYLFGKRTTIN
ncbi:hypothetical protein ASG99_27210 [Bacillus sp. Soil768D1]|nr:hypothetical protein ASG99_27210 [Bacillus sp. Soil768D1]